MITNVTGKFGTFSGTATTDGDDFSTVSAEFSAQIDSITTNDVQRDGHLQSGDFFDAAAFPELKFITKSVSKADSDGEFQINGDLTIKGITKNVNLNGEFGGIGKDPWGNIKAGISVNGKINREDFGLTWNAALETGGVLVSQEVKISCEIQLLKQN